MIAQRRPSHYLTKGRDELAQLTDSHIRLLAQNGVIEPALSTAALASQVNYRDWQQQPTLRPIETNKGISVARSRLAALLNRSLYDLDRLDLAATSTLQSDLQTQATEYLKRLADPSVAGQLGLLGPRLLTAAGTAQVRYSFNLYEMTPDGARVRVQTDNTDQPFDINESSKLELGSTAKLRVLTTYLQIIGELHERYAGQTPAALKKSCSTSRTACPAGPWITWCKTATGAWRTCSTRPSTGSTPPAPANVFLPAAACIASITFATKTMAATRPCVMPCANPSTCRLSG